MPKTILLLFPHQLFRDNPALHKSHTIHLIEDPLYFRQLQFHKQKLILHRATMKWYESWLRNSGYQVRYWASTEVDSLKTVFKELQVNSTNQIRYNETSDYLLERRIKRYSQHYDFELVQYFNPGFLNSADTIRNKLSAQKAYFMTLYYIKERKERDILVDENKQPHGGKWSYDPDNRKKLPKKTSLPSLHFPKPTKEVEEAKQYINQNFRENYGDGNSFVYPITFEQADEWLDQFLDERLYRFGDYEDAFEPNQNYLFHSVLTPMLNIGLITPKQIIERTLEKHKSKRYPLNSLEGFIRQIIGWREYMRGIYLLEGSRQRTTNFWDFSNPLPKSFWTGETGIPPVDQTIKKLLKTGYNHHIERLMVLGNFILLCEINPDEVYEWFMTMYIDAYDCVMVPNVYGMSQYADGGLITTKPYVSSSNYIRRMSHYPKGEWCDIWDGLFWRFIYNHREVFAQNNRMQRMVWMLDQMSQEKLSNHLRVGDGYLNKLFKVN